MRSTHPRAIFSVGLLVSASVIALVDQPLGPVEEKQSSVTVQAPSASASPDSAAMAEGQAIFRGLCSGCHGGAGRGGKGPDLTDTRWIHGGTDADIAQHDPEWCTQHHHEKTG